jgi:hypothetical protein
MAVRVADISAAITGIPSVNLVLAFTCAAASNLCLTGFDTLAVRYVSYLCYTSRRCQSGYPV